MNLQLILVQQSISTYAEVKALTEIQRKQIAIELKAYFGKKVSLKEAFDDECILDYWQVVDAETPEIVLYDFWQMNGDSGGVFYANTVNQTGVEMIQGSYGVQAGWLESKAAENLSDALEVAEKRKQIQKEYEFNDDGEIVNFAAEAAIPADAKQWNKFLKNQKVSEAIIRQYHTGLNKGCWNTISERVALSEDCIVLFSNEINWDLISQHQKLSEGFIRTHQKKLNWARLSMYQRLSEDFIRQFKDQVNWDYISSQQILTEAFIREFMDQISWPAISWAQPLSPGFMREFRDRLQWDNVLSYHDLSETLLREFMPLFDWSCWNFLCMRQNLSIEFINEFDDKINWMALSHNQNLTAEHLRVFKDKLNWNTIIHFGPGMPEALLREFGAYISSYPPNWKTVFTKKDKYPISDAFKKEIQARLKSGG